MTISTSLARSSAVHPAPDAYGSLAAWNPEASLRDLYSEIRSAGRALGLISALIKVRVALVEAAALRHLEPPDCAALLATDLKLIRHLDTQVDTMRAIKDELGLKRSPKPHVAPSADTLMRTKNLVESALDTCIHMGAPHYAAAPMGSAELLKAIEARFYRMSGACAKLIDSYSTSQT